MVYKYGDGGLNACSQSWRGRSMRDEHRSGCVSEGDSAKRWGKAEKLEYRHTKARASALKGQYQEHVGTDMQL